MALALARLAGAANLPRPLSQPVGADFSYRCRRKLPGPRTATSAVRIAIGDRYADDELGERNHFLTARWILFSVAGSRYRLARACHDPWPLHRHGHARWTIG